MNSLRMTLVGALMIATCNPSLAEISGTEKSEIQSMHWTKASGARLDASKSAIVSLPDYQVVVGAESRRFREIVDATGNPNLEADAVDPAKGSELVYEWVPSGFVSSEDWKDIDADSFLAQIKENDAVANQIRQKKGVSTLTTTGWRQTPTLDQETHTVSWAIDARGSDGAEVVNFVALKLGRYGYERIVWIADPSQIGTRNDLLLAVNNHQFDSGARYTDYVRGQDRAAEYGVAALVAGALGVKVAAKLGLIAVLLVFAKKAGVLGFVALAGIGGWFKRRFSRRSAIVNSSSLSVGPRPGG
jgi:uncharacterized membrane-anchored protein